MTTIYRPSNCIGVKIQTLAQIHAAYLSTPFGKKNILTRVVSKEQDTAN